MLVLEWELTGAQEIVPATHHLLQKITIFCPNMPRTNQRAQLLAAIHGLEAYVAGFGTMRRHEDATGDAMKHGQLQLTLDILSMESQTGYLDKK